MTKKRILITVLIIASISSLWFVPWILVKAWVLPLPNTVQEQINEAVGHGFDGMIVYVEQGGKPPELTHKLYSRLPVLASYMLLLLPQN